MICITQYLQQYTQLKHINEIHRSQPQINEFKPPTSTKKQALLYQLYKPKLIIINLMYYIFSGFLGSASCKTIMIFINIKLLILLSISMRESALEC